MENSQKKKPGDYVIASEKQFSVRYFVEEAAKNLGIKIIWKGKGISEVGIAKTVNNSLAPKILKNQIIVKISKKYLRPLDVESLIGNSLKAKRELGWKPKNNIKSLIKEMFWNDYNLLKKNEK